MRRRVALVVLALVAVACGNSGVPDGATPSTTAPATSTTPTESSPASTTVLPTPPETTTPPTTPSPGTIIVEPTQPVPDGALTLGSPDPALLSASPPGEIEWAAVGPGWLLIDHPIGHGAPFVEPTTLDQRGLYLVSPGDIVYGVSALASDGSRIAAVSDDGRQVLLEPYDPACADGCTCPHDATVETQVYGYAILDLPSTSLRRVIDPVTVSVCEPGLFYREVEFTADGSGIWVSETWYTDDQQHAQRVRLSRVEIITGTSTTILDEPVEVDETAPPSSWWISLVDLDDGRIVTTTPTGTWLREPDGAPIRELVAPDTNCDLDRAWDTDHVVARCAVPTGEFPPPPEVPAEQCHTSGLWLMALDGTPAQPLAIPLDDRGYLSCWAGYTNAEQLGDEIAVQVGGDGCSDDVVVISAEGDVTTWQPDVANPCTEGLLGVRNGAWLIGASSESGDGGIFEVTGEGSTRIELPTGEIIVL